MSKTTWIVVGAAAALFLLKRKQDAAMAATASPGVAVAETNLSGISPTFGAAIWRDTPPVDNTVHPRESGTTNPLGDWLRNTFGLNLPVIQPMYLANASAPAVNASPATPSGAYQGSSLGLAAVPGTWPDQAALPAGIDLGDPGTLMSIMVLGDEAVYVPDPVLF